MTPMTYHQNGALLAQSKFADRLRELARELERDVADATPQEKQFLQDVRRGEGRYKLVALRRLGELSRRSTNVAHHEALAEIIRADTLASVAPDVSIDDLMAEETRAQGECDLAQLRFARDQKSPTTRERLANALRRQLAITRRMADRVNAL